MVLTKKIMHKIISLKSLQSSLAVVCCIQILASASSLKEDIEKYFVELKNDFNQVATAYAVKQTNLSRTDSYFVTELKKHQTFYSLIKTNSKGVVISEVIRGEKPERELRNVADQKWFSSVKRTREDYEGFLKEKEQGRYYLLLCKPVLKRTSSGAKIFVGAVAAKVDLWDCFHKFSASTSQPFLIGLNGLKLYSHKWKKETNFKEEVLDIPGIKKITVLYGEEVPTAAAITQDTIPKDTAAKLGTADTKSKRKGKLGGFSFKKLGIFGKILILLMVVALLALIFWFTRVYVRYKDWRLRKKIDKEDNLFG